jgi:hypothetical protein
METTMVMSVTFPLMSANRRKRIGVRSVSGASPMMTAPQRTAATMARRPALTHSRLPVRRNQSATRARRPESSRAITSQGSLPIRAIYWRLHTAGRENP